MDSQRIPLELSIVKLAYAKKAAAAGASQAKPYEGTEDSSLKNKVTEKITAPSKTAEPPAGAINKPAPSKDKPFAAQALKDEEEIRSQRIEAINSVSLERIKESWQDFVSNIGAVKMSIAAYLNEGTALKVEGNMLVISFPKNCSLHKEALETRENKSIIEKSIFDLFNTGLRVCFVLSDVVKKQESHTDNPLIKSTLDMFKGRVIRED